MAVVPITPILPVFVAFDALLAPGSITPITGISNSWVNESRAFELAVLQAITMVLHPCFLKMQRIGGKTFYCLHGFGAVGYSRSISQINYVFVWKLLHNLSHNRKPSDSGVKIPIGLLSILYHPKLLIFTVFYQNPIAILRVCQARVTRNNYIIIIFLHQYKKLNIRHLTD